MTKKKKRAVTPILLATKKSHSAPNEKTKTIYKKEIKGEETPREQMKDASSTTSTASTPSTPHKKTTSSADFQTPSAIHIEIGVQHEEDEEEEEEVTPISLDYTETLKDQFKKTFSDVLSVGTMRGVKGGKKRLWVYTPHSQTLCLIPNLNLSTTEMLSYFEIHLKADSEMIHNPLIVPFVFIIEDFCVETQQWCFEEEMNSQQQDLTSFVHYGKEVISPLINLNIPEDWLKHADSKDSLGDDDLLGPPLKKKSAKQRFLDTANAIVDAISIFTNSLQHLPSKASNFVTSKHSKKKLRSSSSFPDFTEVRQSMPLLCGLSNLGNTCYLNASLQSLAASNDLSEYFLTNQHMQVLNENAIFEGKLALRYGSLIQTMFDADLSEPHRVKSLLASRHRQFLGFHQHDAQELLMCLLEGLHLDLVQSATETRVKHIKSTDAGHLSRNAWLQYHQRHASIIVDLFHGQLSSCLSCSQCQSKSYQFEPFLFLPIPLPTRRVRYVNIVLMGTTFSDDVPRAYAAKPRKYAVRVTPHSLMIEVKKRFAVMLDVPVERVVLCYGQLQKLQLVNPFDTIERVKFTYLFSFVLPEEPLENVLQLFVKHRDALEGMVGLSFMLFVPLSKLPGATLVSKESDDPNVPPTTIHQVMLPSMRPLYELLSTYMTRYLKPKLSHTIPSFDDDDEEEESPFLFRLLHNGTFMDPHHAPPPMSLPSHLSMKESLTVYCDGTFNDDTALNVVVHAPSVHPQKQYDAQVKHVMLEDCIHMFLETEIVQYEKPFSCDHCKASSTYSFKQLTVSVLPPNLIFQLSRFSMVGRQAKNTTHVDYPILFNAALLFPHDATKASLASHFVYELYAVVLHRGGLSSGHYTALIRNYFDASWYLMNDASKRPISPSKVRSPLAYILFYRMRPAVTLSLA